jgi:DNA polymerase-3 subunit delta
MFKEKKFIVLKNTTLNKNFKEEFIKNIKKFAESKNIILFYEAGEILKDGFFNLLTKYGKSQEFKLLEKERLKDWAKKEIENLGAKISITALDKLVEFVGNNLWQMENEIKKLFNYNGGVDISNRANYKREKEIGLNDVEALVRPKIDTDIFKTIDSLAVKNKKQALKLIHQHLEKGDSSLYLLSMINFQFRNLLIVKSDEFKAGKLKIHPYIIRKTREQIRHFSLAELKKIYQKIFKIDLNIKTGKINPETALDLLISEI